MAKKKKKKKKLCMNKRQKLVELRPITWAA